MNPAHLKILAWEHFQRVWRTVVPITLLFASIDLAWQIIFRNAEQGFYDDILIIVYVGIFANMLLLLVSQSTNTDLQFSMNGYYLRLPVKPWLLAISRIVLNIFTLILLTIFFYWVHYHTIRPPDFHPLMVTPGSWWHALSFVALIYLLLQVVAWVSNTWITIAYLMVVGYQVATYNFVIQNFLFMKSSLYWTVFAISIVVLPPLCAYALRYARFNERIPIYAQFGFVAKLFLDSADKRYERGFDKFPNTQEALVWLEKRYMRNVLFGSFLAILVVTLPIWMIEEEFYMSSGNLTEVLLIVAMCLIVAATFSGLVIGLINYRRYATEIKAFTFTKPVSTLALAEGRVRAMTSHILSPGILFQLIVVFCIGGYFFVTDSRELVRDMPSVLQVLMLIYLGYLGTVVLVWCALWCTTTFPLAVFGIYLYAMFYFILDFGDLLYSQDLPEWANYLVIGLTIAPVFIAWIYAGFNQLLTARPWIWVFAPLIMFCVYLILNVSDLEDWDATFFAMALIVTVAAYFPFASAPLTARYARHR